MRTHITLLFTIAILAAGCSKKQQEATPEISISADTLVKTEEAFSRMSEEKGFHAALKAFMADDATKLVDAHLPIIGRDSIARILDLRSDTGIIMTWKARHADIAASGDLGYTWGDWFLRAKHPKDSTDSLYGNYYTVWKKQRDGSWKWVLDGGNATPRPN